MRTNYLLTVVQTIRRILDLIIGSWCLELFCSWQKRELYRLEFYSAVSWHSFVLSRVSSSSFTFCSTPWLMAATFATLVSRRTDHRSRSFIRWECRKMNVWKITWLMRQTSSRLSVEFWWLTFTYTTHQTQLRTIIVTISMTNKPWIDVRQCREHRPVITKFLTLEKFLLCTYNRQFLYSNLL